jgi:putative transposase
MEKDNLKRNRRSIRLSDHDYTDVGRYYVTMCAYQRHCLFGDVVDDIMQLNSWGKIVGNCWSTIPSHFTDVELDEFVIMPNHLHGILVITDDSGRGTIYRAPTIERFGSPVRGSLPTIIRCFKAAVTRRINRVYGATGIWQRSYYEHIIRSEDQLNRIRQYIVENPLKWALDKENPAAR